MKMVKNEAKYVGQGAETCTSSIDKSEQVDFACNFDY